MLYKRKLVTHYIGVIYEQGAAWPC